MERSSSKGHGTNGQFIRNDDDHAVNNKEGHKEQLFTFKNVATREKEREEEEEEEEEEVTVNTFPISNSSDASITTLIESDYFEDSDNIIIEEFKYDLKSLAEYYSVKSNFALILLCGFLPTIVTFLFITFFLDTFPIWYYFILGSNVFFEQRIYHLIAKTFILHPCNLNTRKQRHQQMSLLLKSMKTYITHDGIMTHYMPSVNSKNTAIKNAEEKVMMLIPYKDIENIYVDLTPASDLFGFTVTRVQIKTTIDFEKFDNKSNGWSLQPSMKETDQHKLIFELFGLNDPYHFKNSVMEQI